MQKHLASGKKGQSNWGVNSSCIDTTIFASNSMRFVLSQLADLYIGPRLIVLFVQALDA